ncbi:MAG TPA: hypothetical protein PLN69_04115 [bacterium]|nr:hypothetical protein [bacterium]
MDDISEKYKGFLKEHFRPLRVKEFPNVKIGKLTYQWLLGKENIKRLSHMTSSKIEKLIEKHGIRIFCFEDRIVYIVKPEVERDILVHFYQNLDQQEKDSIYEIFDLDNTNKRLFNNYRVTESAIETLTGDRVDEIEMTSDSLVDFISSDRIIQALENDEVKIFIGEENIIVMDSSEETPEFETYQLILDRPLPGTEISLTELELKERTAIEGTYRDDVSMSDHGFEHNITRMND